MDAWIRFVEHSTYSIVQKKWKQNLVDFVLCSRENLTKFCKHPQNFTIVKIHIHKIGKGVKEEGISNKPVNICGI